MTGEVENALASLTIAEITANNALPIIMGNFLNSFENKIVHKKIFGRFEVQPLKN